MSRALLRSVLELRTPITRLPPTFLLPIRARCFNQTAQIIEPTQQPASSFIRGEPQAVESQTPQKQQQPADTPINTTPSVPQSASPLTEPDASVRALLPLLAAQPGHYATVHIHGRPYLVTEGDQVRLPFRMPGVVPGDVLRLNRATVLGSRDYTLRGNTGGGPGRAGGGGAPAPSSAFVDERLFECRAVVLGTEAEPMRVKIKKKQRTRRKKHVYSKHKYTMLRVSELRINDLEEMER
ncbi:hypothetical protein QBC33DRAFT_497030 [Phialemonium atrogriseum]|uniref:Large ribosomal subunit protein bL21m n=1 Tax=Phialemonium atrogriseum TaxID=1093897 RepID=A0AAJ0BV53_9PEZI|nr:uncharacterized protein QBC33DRAFT_497030 [Phialemonium atrogriseum]KAK1764567.1 hypothetical protein QBC33DRAFT_497030 [Phialemonium atrogriseum]